MRCNVGDAVASPFPILIALLILLAAGLTALGVGITLYALLRRRRGSTPHCRNCGYNLTGTVSSRCSECGADLESPSATVIGQPVRRRLPIVVGLSILLVGLVPMIFTLSAAARNINWYEFKPAALVLRDMRAGSPTTATRALRELVRRDSLGELSVHQRNKLIEACLAEQNRKTPLATVTQEAVTRLGEMYTGGRLTAEQAEALFAGVTRNLRLEVRPRILKGDLCYCRLYSEQRAPEPFWVRREVSATRLDGNAISGIGGYGGSRGWGGGSTTSGFGLPDLDAGEHVIEIDVAIEILPGGPDDKPAHASTHTIAAQFELLAKEPENFIKMVESAQLGAALAASMSIRDIQTTPLLSDEPMQVRIDFRVSNPIPIGVAFDLLVESAGRTIGRASWTFAKGAVGDYYGVQLGLSEPAEVVDVRLRSNGRRARDTVDLYEIWAGELLFKDVPVVRLSQDQPFAETQVHSPTVVDPD